jgi:O-antigen/teichoic acid export membrane protein
MADNIETKVRGLSRLELEKANSQTLARLIIKSSTLVMVVTLIQKLLGLLLFRTLALHFGPSTFGDWNTAVAFLSFFSVIVEAGIDTIVVREAAKNRSDLSQFVGTALVAKLLLGIVAFSLCVVTAFLLPYRLELKLLIIIASLPLLGGFNSIYADLLQAELKIGYVKVVGLGASVLTTLGGFGVIWLNGNLFILALINIPVSLLVFLMYHRFAQLVTKSAFRFEVNLLKELFKEALPLAFSAICGIVYYRMDTVLLSVLDTNQAVGYYAAAYKLTEALNILPLAVTTALFPLLSKYATTPELHAKLLALYHGAFKYLLVIILPAALSITFLAEKLIAVFYSSEYLPTATAIRLLIWASIPMFVNPVVCQMIIVLGRQGLLTKVSLTMAAFNVAGNLVLIPLISFNGSAVITAITELLGLILCLQLLYKNFGIGLFNEFRAVLLSSGAYIICLPFYYFNNNFVFIVLGALLYLTALQMTRSIRLMEFKYLFLKIKSE